MMKAKASPRKWQLGAYWFAILISGLASTSFPDTAAAQLWERRLPNTRNLILDNRARQAGDILVLEVNESSDVQNRDQRRVAKTGSSASSVGGNFLFSGLFGSGTGGLSAEQESAGDRQFDGNTQMVIKRGILDRVTVTVIDVLPNGNMLISGKRTIDVDGDIRTFQASGIVRNVDVTANNTVSSQLVAQLQIFMESSGTESKFINQNWLGRSANKWFPF